MSNSTIEYTEALADQNVEIVECMKIMKEGKAIETDRYMNPFDKSDLPAAVRVTS